MALLRRLVRNKVGLFGAVLVSVTVLAALVAPFVAERDPTKMSIRERNRPPGGDFLFGTDQFGRDVFSRVVYGARVSLWVGFVAVGIGASAGLVLGLLSGYRGGWVDAAIMRVMDVLFAFPAILLALVVIAALGSGLTNTMVAIGITNIPLFTRVVRSVVLTVKELQYVEAARALGASDAALIARHIVPNVWAPVIVLASLGISGAILTEATLSFLGLGIQPPSPSWGSMLNEGRRFMELTPWVVLFPSLAIMVTVIGFNLLGDGLRDTLDPRLRME